MTRISVLPDISEAAYLQQVIHLAHLYGYRCAHFRPALTQRGWRTPVQADGKGFPDLLLVGRGRVLALELKAAKGKVSDDQAAWLAAFEEAGVRTMVARPADFDAVHALLQGTEGTR